MTPILYTDGDTFKYIIIIFTYFCQGIISIDGVLIV